MRKLSLFLLISMLITMACTGPEPTPPSAAALPQAETAADEMSDDMASDMADTMAVVYEAQPWATLPLVNAATGESFTFADLAGRTVYVHAMATWCSNCRSAQQRLRNEVIGQFGDEVVFVSISVESGLAPDRLGSYAQQAGFDWLFAVASDAIMQEWIAAFGRTISSPPSTPHFIIRPDGSVTSLLTGASPASEIINRIRTEGGL